MAEFNIHGLLKLIKTNISHLDLSLSNNLISFKGDERYKSVKLLNGWRLVEYKKQLNILL